jgi:hypothetical protein
MGKSRKRAWKHEELSRPIVIDGDSTYNDVLNRQWEKLLLLADHYAIDTKKSGWHVRLLYALVVDPEFGIDGFRLDQRKAGGRPTEWPPVLIDAVLAAQDHLAKSGRPIKASEMAAALAEIEITKTHPGASALKKSGLKKNLSRQWENRMSQRRKRS